MRSSSILRLALHGLFIFVFCSVYAVAAQLVVAWDDVVGETGFNIERSTDGAAFAPLATVGTGVTSYTDATVVAGTCYWYRVQAFNATTTSGYSNIASATVPVPATAPLFTTQPVSATVTVGGSVTFSASATGSPAPSFQWFKSGQSLTGATSSTLTLPSVTTLDAGTYTVVATNSAGSVTSNGAVLTVNTPPSFTTQPVSQVCTVGATVTFSVSVAGSPLPTVQWRKDGTAIAGATSTTLTLVNVDGTAAGTYTVVATNSAGSATSSGASLVVNQPVTLQPPPPPPPATTPGRLSAVSVRAVSAPWGSAAVQLGFTTEGAQKSLLLRAIGPSLASLTTLTVSADPKLTVWDGNSVIDSNDNWGGSTALADTFAQVGAFSLPAASKDAALVVSVAPKTYNAAVGGQARGLVLAEIYDADPTYNSTAKLTSVLGRGPVGTGEAVLNAGFVIAGDTPVRLLVRAVGSSLKGLQGLLSNPELEIYRGTTSIAYNDNWGGGSDLSSLFKLVGADSLSVKSKDSALDITLAPGVYSAVIRGVNNTTGLARIEFYVVP